jgi:hypothetical protein
MPMKQKYWVDGIFKRAKNFNSPSSLVGSRGRITDQLLTSTGFVNVYILNINTVNT